MIIIRLTARCDMDNNGNQYSYYQNLYNMFGGYNPIFEERVGKLRRTGFIIGIGMLFFTMMQYVVLLLLKLFGIYDLYCSDPVFEMGISAIAPVIYVFLPFIFVYLLYTPKQKESVDIFNLPKSKELFIFSVLTGLMVCSIGDRAASFVSAIADLFGADFEGPETSEPSSVIGYILQIIAYAVIPPLVEEFAMRGVVMQPLRKYGDKFAIIVSSVLFAALHGNMAQIPFAFIAGCVLGYFAIVTDSIWTSVAIHALNNLSAVIISIFYTRNPDASMFFYIALEGLILAVGAVAFIFFLRTDRKRLRADKSEIDGKLKYSTVFCTPTIAASLMTALSTSASYTALNSSLGKLFTAFGVALAAFLLIKGSKKAKNDYRIHPNKMYTVTTVIVVVAAIFILIGILMTPVSLQ